MAHSPLSIWENQIIQRIVQDPSLKEDPAHDFAHLQRVASTAKLLTAEEGASFEVVIPAAWLHDFVYVPKNDPRRKIASKLSADAAVQYLESIQYPSQWLEEIHHAIQAHSYSAQGQPRTKEAAIVQDADRLDSLGAIGIARCFTVGGLLQRQIYDPLDMLAQSRPLNDAQFTVDHFYTKLLKLHETLLTSSGKAEGKRRTDYMKDFLKQLNQETAMPSYTGLLPGGMANISK